MWHHARTSRRKNAFYILYDRVINTSKTKEVLIDFRKNKTIVQPVQIRSEAIEQVDQYKYLGTYIDSKLSWKFNTDYICKKGRQRLHLLRQLRQFSVDRTIMQMVYRTFIQSVLCFNFVCWYGSLTVQDKNHLLRFTTTTEEKIIGPKRTGYLSFQPA